MELHSIVAQLRAWSQQQGLVDKAIASCKVSLQNLERDEGEQGQMPHISPNDMELCFRKQSLVFNHSVLDYLYIDTEIGLYVEDEHGKLPPGLREVGHYRLITTLDGQTVDDYLVMEE